MTEKYNLDRLKIFGKVVGTFKLTAKADVAYISHPDNDTIKFDIPSDNIINLLSTEYESVFLATFSSIDESRTTSNDMIDGLKLYGSKTGSGSVIDIESGEAITNSDEAMLFIFASFFRFQTTNIYQCIMNNKIVEIVSIVHCGNYNTDNPLKDLYYTKVSNDLGNLRDELFRFTHKDPYHQNREPKFDDSVKVINNNLIVAGDFDFILSGPAMPQVFVDNVYDVTFDTNMTHTATDNGYRFTNVQAVNYLTIRFNDDTFFKYSSDNEDIIFKFMVHKL
jgi:hypothetical protein